MRVLKAQFQWFLCVLVVLASAATHAEEHVFRLEYVERGLGLALTEDAEFRKVSFTAEPEYMGSPRRGTIPVGPGKQDLVGFAVDTVARVAYVDLNRNGDLTDDGKGFRASGDNWYQSYSGIPLTLSEGDAPRKAVVAMEHWPFGNVTKVRATSGWLAQVDFMGELTHIGVIDNLDGVITPDDRLFIAPDKPRTPATVDGRGPKIAFTDETSPYRSEVRPHIWLNGHAYDVTFAFEPDGEKPPALVATFADATPKTAPLTLEGTIPGRLMLMGDTWLTLADSPGSTLEIPEDLYSSQRIHIAKDGPYFEVHTTLYKVLDMKAGGATLKAGGPVGPSIYTARSGNTLTLRPVIRGIGDEVYESAGEGRSPLPAFSVFRGDKQICSGKFEYG